MIQRPLAWLCMSFLGGVAVAEAGWLPNGGWGYAAVLLGWIALWWIGRPRIALALGLAATFALGGWRMAWHQARQARDALQPCDGGRVILLGWVSGAPREENARWSWQLQATAVQVRRQVRPAAARVMVYSDEPPDCQWGDWVAVSGRLQRPPDATNPGGRSLHRILARKGMNWMLRSIPGARPHRFARDGGPWLMTRLQQARSALVERLSETMPRPYSRQMAALLASLLYGLYAAPIPEPIEDAFRRSGLIHLLVASGTQVSLLVTGIVLLSRWLALPRVLLLPLGTTAIVLFALLAGGEPSIWRATGMGMVLLLALWAGRVADPPTSLALAIAGLVAARPLDLFSPSLHLSVAAVAGLIHLGVPLEGALGFLPHWLRAPLALTLAAQLALWPILADEFQRVSLVAPLSNLPGYFLAGLLMAGGILASLLSWIWLPAAAAVNTLNHGLLTMLVSIAVLLAGCRLSELRVSISTPVLAVYALALAQAPTLRERWAQHRLTPEQIVVVVALLLAGGSALFGWRASRVTLQVTVLDVGNGDAVLIQSPDGQTALIDAGPYQEAEGRVYDAGERVVVPALLQMGVRRLQWMVLTHGHDDHLGGALAVLHAVPVERLLIPPLPTPSQRWEAARRYARQEGIPILLARRGMRIPLGRHATLHVLWPPNPPYSGTSNDVNNNALVLKLIYGRTSFLFMGDQEQEGEEALLACGDRLRSTMLKVPHHGSNHACGEALLQRVLPSDAVISVGRGNPHNHPNADVLERLARHGIRVHRTDRDGAIIVRTDGNHLQVTAWGR